MNYDAAHRLREFVDSLMQRGECREHEIAEIVSRARQLIERGNLKKTYPTIKMYGDWIAHVGLNQNSYGHEILQALDKFVVDGFNGVLPNLEEMVSKTLGLRLLRFELKRIFAANSIDTVFFDNFKNWFAFCNALVSEVLHKPITFPDDIESNPKARGHGIYRKMLKYREGKDVPDGTLVRAFFMSMGEDIRRETSGVMWHLRLGNTRLENFVEIVGGLKLEVESEFTIR